MKREIRILAINLIWIDALRPNLKNSNRVAEPPKPVPMECQLKSPNIEYNFMFELRLKFEARIKFLKIWPYPYFDVLFEKCNLELGKIIGTRIKIQGVPKN